MRERERRAVNNAKKERRLAYNRECRCADDDDDDDDVIRGEKEKVMRKGREKRGIC